MNKRLAPLGAGILLVAVLIVGPACRKATPTTGEYPYGGPAFHRFVLDSYQATGSGDASQFHAWMSRVARESGPGTHPSNGASWTERLARRRNAYSRLTSVAARAAYERKEASELHAWEKKAIPRFSLDRGFEFPSVVNLGERQCLLQSVLLASLLQRTGMDAGAVMVYRNPEGQESNIGHVVTFLKLANGRDILVDASHKEPFVRHEGLYTRVTGLGYRFVEPVFAPGSAEIKAYRLAATGATVPARQVRGLDTAFLRSQFAYYRGERTPGGILSSKPTSKGLGIQLKCLQDSVTKCASNPLATYMLGRVYLASGRPADAYRLAERACALYAKAGWTPPDPRQALNQARAAVSTKVARDSG